MPTAEGMRDGLWVWLTTPLHDAGRVDLGAVRRNLEGYGAAPVAGYVIGGAPSESSRVAAAEWREMVSVVLDTARRPVWLVMEPTDPHALRDESRWWAEQGVAGLWISAIANDRGQVEAEGLAAYWITLAEASALPLSLLWMPVMGGPPPEVGTLCSALERGVTGIVDGSGDVQRWAEIMEHAPAQATLANVSAPSMVAVTGLGVRVHVLPAAAALPFELAAVVALCGDGRWSEALHAIAVLGGALRAMERWGPPAVKRAMDLLGYRGGPVRLPLQSASPEVQATLVDALRAAGLIRF